MDAKEVAVLITETVDLAISKQTEVLNEKIRRLKELLSLERDTWCRDSEDRMYRFDGTWFFRNNDGLPQLAPPPEPVIRMAAELISISKKRKISQSSLRDAKAIMDYVSKLKS